MYFLRYDILIFQRQTGEKISEEQAKQTCSNMISGSLAFTSYKNMTASESPDIVINQCVFDLMVNKLFI